MPILSRRSCCYPTGALRVDRGLISFGRLAQAPLTSSLYVQCRNFALESALTVRCIFRYPTAFSYTAFSVETARPFPLPPLPEGKHLHRRSCPSGFAGHIPQAHAAVIVSNSSVPSTELIEIPRVGLSLRL